jgi:hypothetical protein
MLFKIFSVHDSQENKLECLSLASFLPSSIFVGEGGAYQSGAINGG